MSMAAMTELEAVVEDVAADESVTVLVITGGVNGYFVADRYGAAADDEQVHLN